LRLGLTSAGTTCACKTAQHVGSAYALWLQAGCRCPGYGLLTSRCCTRPPAVALAEHMWPPSAGTSHPRNMTGASHRGCGRCGPMDAVRAPCRTAGTRVPSAGRRRKRSVFRPLHRLGASTQLTASDSRAHTSAALQARRTAWKCSHRSTGPALAANLAAKCTDYCIFPRTTADLIMTLTSAYGRQRPTTNVSRRP
jgi:hypothetical protein